MWLEVRPLPSTLAVISPSFSWAFSFLGCLLGVGYGHARTLGGDFVTDTVWGETTPSLGAPIANNENRAHESGSTGCGWQGAGARIINATFINHGAHCTLRPNLAPRRTRLVV